MVTLDMQELYVGTLIVLGDNKRNGKECCCVYLGKEMCLCFREHMPIISQNTTQLIAPACQSSGQCRGGGGEQLDLFGPRMLSHVWRTSGRLRGEV